MYICICSQVTDGQIRDVVKNKGMTRLRDVCRELGTCQQCGKCAGATRQLVKECLDQSTRRVGRIPPDRRQEPCIA